MHKIEITLDAAGKGKVLIDGTEIVGCFAAGFQHVAGQMPLVHLKVWADVLTVKAHLLPESFSSEVVDPRPQEGETLEGGAQG